MSTCELSAICEVKATGEEVVSLLIEYGESIRASSLPFVRFSVSGATVSDVALVSDSAVMVHLQEGLPTLLKEGERVIHRVPTLTVMQEGVLQSMTGESLTLGEEGATVTQSHHIQGERFNEHEYKSPHMDNPLAYSLFLPRDYDPNASYPLLLFIHDRGVVSAAQRLGLVQGLGGVVWTDEEEQRQRPCIVLVPHYRRAIVNDRFEATEELEATYRLLVDEILPSYPIDRNRIYGTGQSMGCMSLLEMGMRYPDLFAGLLLVAGQWDPSRITLLKDVPMWVLVGEGDSRAFNGMNSCMAGLEDAGIAINRVFWDGALPVDSYADLVTETMGQGFAITYTVFEGNSVVRPEFGLDTNLPMMLQNHMATWRLVYQIPGLRAWLFAQKRIGAS